MQLACCADDGMMLSVVVAAFAFAFVGTTAAAAALDGTALAAVVAVSLTAAPELRPAAGADRSSRAICRALGRRAWLVGMADGLLSASARRGGTCMRRTSSVCPSASAASDAEGSGEPSSSCDGEKRTMHRAQAALEGAAGGGIAAAQAARFET